MNRFKAIVRAGISTQIRCAFITITYKAGAERLNHAGCVARDWKAFLRLLQQKHPELRSLPMLRVMELTKQGTPHFHLCIGSVPSDTPLRCYGNSFEVGPFLRRWNTCPCLSHKLARVWSAVQNGESWIVHCVPVRGAGGAAVYLAKYMAKEFDGERMEVLGMKRRFSKSRNWPSEPRARLEGSHGKGWRRSWFKEGWVDVESLKPGLSEEAGKMRRTERQQEEVTKQALRRVIAAGKELGHVD